mgnify:CR=1 FL=1
MRRCLILCLFTFISSLVCWADAGKDAYLFRKVDYQQGLSNSAVLCLYQDKAGLMWFGTYDGVNCYDGKGIEVFRSDFSMKKTLSNNVIHSIQQADSSCLWITTHLGVNRFSQDSRQVVGYYDFTGDYYLHSNPKGDTWVVSDEGIFYYNTYHKKFVHLKNIETPVENMDQRAFVTDDGVLWTFPRNTGSLIQCSLDGFDRDTLSVHPTVSSSDFHAKPIDNVFYQNGILCFVDAERDLYVYDISRRSKIYIRNLSSLVQQYGKVVGIVPFYEDIIIAFQTNGLVRLRTSKKYEEEVVDRNVRIYDIFRDPHQNILWVASDGQGAVMYAKKYSIATNLMLSKLSSNLRRQVRSVMTDKYGGLWFGTKGDGLLHVHDYEGGMDASKAVACASTEQDKFEVFTKLEGGKTYKLVDRAAEGAKVFYINGNKIMEGEGETTVEKTGVYRIEMDFSIASVTVREVSKMEFYFCPSGAATFELPYVGNGVFCGQDKIEFKQEGWGRDQRYKFLMTYADGSIQYWGTKNTTDSNPGAATPEDPYFYIMETPDNQWDQKWKLNNEFDGAADGHNPGAITILTTAGTGRQCPSPTRRVRSTMPPYNFPACKALPERRYSQIWQRVRSAERSEICRVPHGASRMPLPALIGAQWRLRFSGIRPSSAGAAPPPRPGW